MSPMSIPNALIIDANLLISVCSKEPTAIIVQTELENYALNGWEFVAPNVIVAEVLFILCQKLQNGLLTPTNYNESIENFQDSERRAVYQTRRRNQGNLRLQSFVGQPLHRACRRFGENANG